jgi:hypothetical protein
MSADIGMRNGFFYRVTVAPLGRLLRGHVDYLIAVDSSWR